MAVQIPPWLNIDPIEPARILERTNSRRAANAAAERRAQLEEQRLFSQQQMMNARLAAQERASQRKEQVMRETRDAQLAQQAAAMEFRRQMANQTNQRQLQQLRLREQQVEQQASSSARQLQGMRTLQEDLGRGVPLEQALAKNAANLFSNRPERLASAMKAAETPGPPQAFTAGGMSGVYNPRTGAPSFPPRLPSELGPEAFQARDITDPQGNPTGIRAIPGRGSARVLPGQMNLRPGDRINALKTRLSLIQTKMLTEATKAELPSLKKERDGIEEELRQITAPAEELSPGKVDERVGPEEEDDFLLPPAGDEGEEAATDAAGEEELDEEELAEQEMEMAEDF